MADINADISQWSNTAASNTPADSTNVGSGLGDNLRTLQAVVRSYLAHYNSVAIVSGATTDLGANTGLVQEVSGVAGITSLGTVSAGVWKIVRFQGAATLTNSASLALPGGANILTAAGDHMLAYSKGSGNWVVPLYQKADGTAPVFIAGLTAGTVVAADDLVAIWDTSLTANRKVALSDLSYAFVPVGTVWKYIGASAPTGWLLLQGGTIGDAASGGTALANASASALFTLLYDDWSDAAAPVSGGRGANAAADFAAHKTITLPDFRGRSAIGVGQGLTAEGGGAGTSRTMGDKVGAETHTITIAEMPSHNHGMFAAGAGGANKAIDEKLNARDGSWTGLPVSGQGGDTAHNNMGPVLAMNFIIKY